MLCNYSKKLWYLDKKVKKALFVGANIGAINI